MIYNPTISIVTVVYNGEKFLEKTIQSVLSQTYKNIEYIIIDGGSTDGTLDIIKRYEDKIDYWVSEVDKGIYDAMNKGALVASGDFINYLNADDRFNNDTTLENIVKNIDTLDSVYYTRASVISEKVCWLYPEKKVIDYQKWLKLNLPNHQTMFFPKSFYKKYFYDLRLKIGADDDYKLYAIKNHNVQFIDIISVEFLRGGVSSNHNDFKLFKQRLKESYIRNYKHKRWIRLLIDPFKLLLMYFIYTVFGETFFLKFIKMIVHLKGGV
jgi:putative colanic acid biosynthesis glycosyltransferase